MKILLIEDHASLAEMSCRLLEDVHEHEVAQAASGREALDLVTTFAPDLALIDLNLPDMTGYELARQIRANPTHARVVLVALTGWGNLVDNATAVASGFDAHFRKPMDFALLPTLRRQAGKE